MLKRRYLILILVPLALFSLFVGVADLSLAGLVSGQASDWQLLWSSRLPRLMAILMAGAGLSVCGLIMQSLTRNRFVSPTTAGLFDCARLGVLLAIIVFPAATLLIKAGFAMLVTLLGALSFMAILAKLKHQDPIFVPLVGMIFGGIVSAVTTFIALQLDLLQNIMGWMQGDFSSILQGRYELIYLSLPILALIYYYANRFVMVGLGQDFAVNLGLHYKQVMFIGLVLISVMTAVVIVTVGAIPFLGLIVPNIVSLYLGDQIRNTMSHTALLGALLVLLCDVFGRLVIFPYELPISLIMGVLGSVMFLWLLIRRMQHA